MDEGTFERASDFIRGLFDGDSGGHDYWHSVRVHDLARTICEAEGGDSGIVRLAALLHDADDRKLFGEGSGNARRFMDSEGIPADVQDRICSVISQISFRGRDTVVPDTLEGRIVQDADRLDAIGAIGIARAFAYGGSRGRDMHVPGEAHREGMSGEEYFANRGTTINHFHEKLLLLRDMMNTPTARRMADARHDYMVGFLEEFSAEWAGERRPSLQHEAVLRELDDPVALHPAQLAGQGAAVHPEMVGHLLAVHRYQELVAPCPAGLVREVGAHLLPDAPLGHLVQPHVEVQGLPGQRPDEVPHHPGVELAGRRARGGYPEHVEEHHLRHLRGHQAGVHALPSGARVIGAHHVPGAVGVEERAVPPPVLLDDLQTALQDDAEAVHGAPAAEDELSGGVAVAPGLQASAHGGDLVVGDPLEQAGVPQDGRGVSHGGVA